MIDFIKSLNQAQKEGLVDLIQNQGRMLPTIAFALEEQNNGNPEHYEQLFGADAKPQANGPNSIDNSSSSAIEGYVKRKMEAFEATKKAEAVRKSPYTINEGR